MILKNHIDFMSALLDGRKKTTFRPIKHQSLLSRPDMYEIVSVSDSGEATFRHSESNQYITVSAPEKLRPGNVVKVTDDEGENLGFQVEIAKVEPLRLDPALLSAEILTDDGFVVVDVDGKPNAYSAGDKLVPLAEAMKSYWDIFYGSGSFDRHPWVWRVTFGAITPAMNKQSTIGEIVNSEYAKAFVRQTQDLCSCSVCCEPYRKRHPILTFLFTLALCPECGSKRCQKTTDHRLQCQHL